MGHKGHQNIVEKFIVWVRQPKALAKRFSHAWMYTLEN